MLDDEYKISGGSRITSRMKTDGRRRTGRTVAVSGLRSVSTDGEMYAVVTKVYGNGMCEVKCIDDKVRTCVIRKKFRGRRKRENFVGKGVVVLVGMRTWERPGDDGKEKCDLLEVYTMAEVRKLKQRSNENFDKLDIESLTGNVTHDFEFDTSNHADFEDSGDGDDESDDSNDMRQPNRYDVPIDDSDDEDAGGNGGTINVDDI